MILTWASSNSGRSPRLSNVTGTPRKSAADVPGWVPVFASSSENYQTIDMLFYFKHCNVKFSTTYLIISTQKQSDTKQSLFWSNEVQFLYNRDKQYNKIMYQYIVQSLHNIMFFFQQHGHYMSFSHNSCMPIYVIIIDYIIRSCQRHICARQQTFLKFDPSTSVILICETP